MKITSRLFGDKQIPNLSRDLNGAREAFSRGDVDGSRLAHSSGDDRYAALFGAHNENHSNTSGEFVKAMVFGGLDGIVTVFAIVAGCVGAKLLPSQIVVVGLGNLLADAFSMGFGEYVSAVAEDEFVAGERRREIWEIENCPEDEKNEMREIYIKKYEFSASDAEAMVNLGFKYRKFFLSHMMVEELGLMAPDEESEVTPLKRGLVMFCSFASCGLLPLLGFVLFLFISNSTSSPSTDKSYQAFLFSCVVVMISLFSLGVAKARFAAQPPLNSGLIMCLNGCIASTLAYGIGAVLQRLVIGSN